MMACTNNTESLVKQFENAAYTCDAEKANEIMIKITELDPTKITDEQSERLQNALNYAMENCLSEEEYDYEEPVVDYSADNWKKYTGTTYRASQMVSNMWQNYAFSYSSNGTGRYFIFTTIPGTNVVEDQMDFTIYKVTSDDSYIYLHCNGLNSTVKIKIKGHSLYLADGSEKYEVWQ
jgi:hypothetical protein